jgi:polyisoprenoid-binding protein YceI
MRITQIVGRRWARIQLAALMACAAAWGQSKPIDVAHSTMTVRVFKTGMLSAFGHDHEIAVPVAEGSVDAGARKVELRVAASALRVADAKASDKDRGEIQSTMLGAEVLDAQNFKEIRFRSTSATQSGRGAWAVAGDLTLHGQTRPVSVQVREKDGRYSGTCKLNITEFGIKPVKAAGGAVRVKDEVQIDFDIQVAR